MNSTCPNCTRFKSLEKFALMSVNTNSALRIENANLKSTQARLEFYQARLLSMQVDYQKTLQAYQDAFPSLCESMSASAVTGYMSPGKVALLSGGTFLSFPYLVLAHLAHGTLFIAQMGGAVERCRDQLDSFRKVERLYFELVEMKTSKKPEEWHSLSEEERILLIKTHQLPPYPVRTSFDRAISGLVTLFSPKEAPTPTGEE